MAETQESRTVTVAFRVTPREKRGLDLVLQVRQQRGEAAEGMLGLFKPTLSQLLEEAEGYTRQLAGLS